MSATPNGTTGAMSGLRTLTLEESSDLIRLEDTIQRGLGTFIEVGEALTEIRDRKLYLIEHTTFAEYCKVKWNVSDRRARQLMGAAEVVADISKSGTIVPKTESQARPLAALPRALRAEAWQKAAATSPHGQPTAKVVHAIVEKMNPKTPKAPRIHRKGIMRVVFALSHKGVEVMSVERQECHSITKFEMSFTSICEVDASASLLREKAKAIVLKAREFEKGKEAS